jgi:hypothetical protein
LRCSRDPIVGRISDNRVVLDLRSVAAPDDESFATAVVRALTE